MKKADKLRDLERYKASVANASFHNDGYRNMLNKVGTKQDNSTAWEYESNSYESDLEMTHIYETNGLFSKIINRPAEDCLAKGLDLSDLGNELADKVNKKLTFLHFTDRMIEAEKWSRLYGGSIAVLLIDDGRGLDEPLNVKHARSIEEIRVFERAIVQPDYTGLYTYSFYDPDEYREVPWGQPEYYYVYSVYGQFRVHWTRCLIFKNGKVPEYTAAGFYRFFGIPEYLKIKDFMREVVNGHHDGIKLLERSVLGVYKMKNLSTLLATDEGEDKVIQRLQVIDMARNIINSMAIDAEGEDYSYINASMAGASDLIDRTCNMLSSVTDIPQTILFGRSPAGMDATGDNDMENYYQLLSRIQRTNLKDNTETVISLILQELIAKGKVKEEDIPEYEVKFVPFKQMTEQEQAAIDQQKAATEATKAQTAATYVQMQALDPSEVRKALSDSDEYQIQGLVDEDNLELPEGVMDLGKGGVPGQVAGTAQVPQHDHLDEFNEEDHPRDVNGQFTSGSGSSSGGRYYPYKATHEKVKNLESALGKARSTSGINKVALAAHTLVKNIDKELENPEDPDGVHALKAARYKAEKLIKKCEQKYRGDENNLEVLKNDENWDPTDHPRNEAGQFTETNNGGTTLKEKPSVIKDRTQKRYGDSRKQLPVPHHGKIEDDELEEYNRNGLNSIIEETGLDEKAAKKVQKSMQKLHGGKHSDITEGRDKESIDAIDDGLSRMAAYDGQIFRGMHFDNPTDAEQFASKKSGDSVDMRSVSCWSAKSDVAERMASIMDWTQNSVMLHCVNNKTAVGTQHLSKWGDYENEVTAKSKTRWQVVDSITESKYDYLERRYKSIKNEKDRENQLLVLEASGDRFKNSKITYLIVEEL